MIQADVATASTAASLIEIGYELGRIATQGVTEEELESARRYALGALSFETATQDGLASTLAKPRDPGSRSRLPGSVRGRLEGERSAHEVDEAARRLLAPSQMVTVVLGDADQVVGGSLALVAEVQPRPISAPG